MRPILARLIFTVFCFTVVCTAKAQLIVNAQLPPAGLMQKDQLWNIVIVNNYEITKDVQIQIVMVDINNGQKILTATSRLFTVIKGAKQLRINDVSPVEYNYGISSAFNDRTPNGLLPLGRFQLCYTLLINDVAKTDLPVSEDCQTVEIQPLSPPQLNYPANKDTITTRYPTFQWLPPAPYNMFNNLNYEIMLVEVNPGQNAYDAVQKNAPLYMQGRIKDLVYQQPSSSIPLAEGKTYAWQVIATNNDSYTEKTDTWSFTVSNPQDVIEVAAAGYARLQQGLGTLCYVFNEKLSFAYQHDGKNANVKLKISEVLNGNKKVVYQESLAVKPGDNFLNRDFATYRLSKNILYRLDVENDQKEVWSLLFKYQPAEN
jgi:hypothetical protein